VRPEALSPCPKQPATWPFKSDVDPFYAHLSCRFKIYFNIILPSTPRSFTFFCTYVSPTESLYELLFWRPGSRRFHPTLAVFWTIAIAAFQTLRVPLWTSGRKEKYGFITMRRKTFTLGDWMSSQKKNAGLVNRSLICSQAKRVCLGQHTVILYGGGVQTVFREPLE
jgi:hypothetical protein